MRRYISGAWPVYRPVGPGLQQFLVWSLTLRLVINYALLGWAKKLKSSKCWWGQCVLVMRAIFRICGNEGHPGPQLVEKQATPLYLNGKLSTVRLTVCLQLTFSQVHLQRRALIKDTHHHHYLGLFPRTEHEQTCSLLGFLGWTRGISS